jgi:hypothetical protein
MNHQEPTQPHLAALRRAEELELRWQDERAQRQRASALFVSDLIEIDDSGADDEDDE